MPSPSKPTLAFFGATGGCTSAALLHALNAEYSCTVLARTPQKLHDLLTTRGASAATLERLHVVKGDIRDAAAVKSALCSGERPVDIIICGVGMDIMAKHPDTTICQDGTRSILAGLDVLAEEGTFKGREKPFLCAISTTGIANGPRDVPIAMLPMYHMMLKAPHADKRVMEDELEQAGKAGRVGGWCTVRPSFLIDGKDHGREKVKQGKEGSPAVGYVISRADVGRWMFEDVIFGDPYELNGEKPSITL